MTGFCEQDSYAYSKFFTKSPHEDNISRVSVLGWRSITADHTTFLAFVHEAGDGWSQQMQMNNEYLNILHSIIFYKTSLSDTFLPFWVSLCNIYQHCNMVMGHFCVPALCLMHLWTNLSLLRSFSDHFLSSIIVLHTRKFQVSMLVH